MTPVLDRASQRWLDEHAHRWASDGIVTPEQADAIVQFEHEPAPSSTPTRVPVAAELLVYLGSVLAAVGGAFVVVNSWDALGWAGRLAVGTAVAALGLVSGVALHRPGDPATERLAGFAWLAGAAGVALTVGVVAVELGSTRPSVTALAIGAVLAPLGLALWRNLERPLQLLTSIAGVVTFLVAARELVGARPALGSAIGWLLAAGFVALSATDHVRPKPYALAFGSVLAMAAAASLTDVSMGVGLALGVATAAGIVAVGLGIHQVAMVVVGVIGFLQFLQGVIGQYVRGAAGGLVLLVGGIVVVVVAVRVISRRARPRPTA